MSIGNPEDRDLPSFHRTPPQNVTLATLHRDNEQLFDLLLLILERQMSTSQDLQDALAAQTQAITDQGAAIVSAITALQNGGGGVVTQAVLDAVVSQLQTNAATIVASTNAIIAALGAVVTPPGSLAVIAQAPPAGATNVNPVAPIALQFNQSALNDSSLSVILTDSAGNAVAATQTYDPTSNTVTLTPSTQLDLSAQYGVTVNAEDANGVAMPTLSFAFTTAASVPAGVVRRAALTPVRGATAAVKPAVAPASPGASVRRPLR